MMRYREFTGPLAGLVSVGPLRPLHPAVQEGVQRVRIERGRQKKGRTLLIIYSYGDFNFTVLTKG